MQVRSVATFIPTTLAVCCLFALALPQPALAQVKAQSAQAIPYQIGAGTLDSALNKFATQSRLQVVYSPELVAGKKSPGLFGHHSPQAALKKLLQGTGLAWDVVNESMYVLRKTAPATRADPSSNSPGAVVLPPLGDREKDVQELEKMVVVGSRLGTSPVESAMPIKIITREDIDRSGAGNIAQALTYLSEVPLNSTGDREIGLGTGLADGGNTNSSTVQMRGLPRGTTLILINGRRAGDSAMFSSTGQFDLSTIPLALVERIEVLPAGSSAVYGGDGLAGVINVVLRRDANGAELRLRRTMADGYDREMVSAMWGKSWSRGSMTVTANWNRNDSLFSSERSISADQDFRRFGGYDRRLSSGNPTTVFSLAGCPAPPASCSRVPLATRAPLPGLNFPMATVPLGRDGKDLTPADFLGTQGQIHKSSSNRHLISAEKNHGININSQVELLPALEVFSELTYTKRSVPAYQLRFGLSGENGSIAGRIEANHPYNPFGVPVGVAYAYSDTGFYTAFSQEHVRGLMGLRGKFRQFDWELTGMQSRDKAGSNGAVGFDSARIVAALAVTDPATAINPFVTDGSAPASREVLESLLNTSLDHKTASRGDVWTGFIRGPVFTTPAGEVQALLGLERQRQEIRIDSNSASLVTKYVDGVSKSNAGFAEVRVPILSARQGSLERIAMTGAVRRESSDRFKDQTQTETFGLEVRPSNSLLLRSTYSTAFRPLLAYSAVQDPTPSEFYFLDPRFNNEEFLAPGFLTGGIPPELGPETSKTITIGALYRPSPDASLSITYWNMKFRDRIAFVEAQTLLDNEDHFRDRVVRDPVTGLVSYLDVRQVNISLYDSAGVDISAQSYFPTKIGDFNAGLSATYTFKHQTQLTDTSPLLDRIAVRSSEGWAPRWKIVPRVGWEPRSGISTMLVGRYVSRYRDSEAFVTGPTAGTFGDLGDFWMFDINADVELDKLLGAGSRFRGTRLTFGATNVFDKQPVFCMSCGLGGYDASIYDIVGRTFYAELRLSF
jgi:iron complex outermembrane receptor protein